MHTTFNSLSSRFEISLDDNRNSSYPFEYCWQKSTDCKAQKSDKSGNEDSDDDEFEEMWEYSINAKNVDTAADFANEVVPVPKKTEEGTSGHPVIDTKLNFANEIEVIIPKSENISTAHIDKKS